jgi:purine catabolism regulator
MCLHQSAATLARPSVPSQPTTRPVLRAVPAPRLDAAGVLGEAARSAMDVLGADACVVIATDGERRGLRVVAHAGLDAEAVASLDARVKSDLVRRAVRGGRAVRSLDVATDERSAHAVVAATGITSALLVPLGGDLESTGVLVVGSRGRRAFTDAEATVLALVAENAVVALENLRLQAAQSETSELQRQNAVLRRVRDAHEELARASLDGAGLGELVAVLARLSGLHLTLTTAAGKTVAAAGEIGASGACAGTHAVPVVAGGEILATLTAAGAPVLAEADAIVLQEGASLLAAGLLRELSILDAEVRLHGGLLESLIGAGGGETVETRAALLGIDLDAAQCLVAVARGEDGTPDLAVAIAAGQGACARLGIRGVFAQRDQAILALLVSADRCVSREVVTEWSEAFKAQLAQRGAVVPGAVGVSALPLARGQVREGVAGAEQALRVAQMCRGGEVTFLQEVELLAVFADSMKHEQLKGYVDHCIGELLAYDERTNSELVRTLEVYLDHSCVARHAAAALFLHPHSLRYRLRRIEEVQGLDLQDAFARLTAHLATKVRPLFVCA